MSIAKVEPLLTTRSVRGPFDYRLPESMDGVEVGSVLVVPFGRQRVKGVVVELAETSDVPEAKLAEPFEALEAGVPPELVELGRWVGEEYCSTPAARPRARRCRPGWHRGADARSVRTLTELEVEATPRGPGRRWTGRGAARAAAEGRPARRSPPGRRRPQALATTAGSDRATIRRLEERGLRHDARGRAPPAPARDLGRRRQRRRRAERRPARRGPTRSPTRSTATAASWLLHGVTGSGKTEVYLEAARAALERGQGRDRARARDRADAADR